jgi:hypothetical protein
MILLLLPSKCNDYRYEQACLVENIFGFCFRGEGGKDFPDPAVFSKAKGPIFRLVCSEPHHLKWREKDCPLENPCIR